MTKKNLVICLTLLAVLITPTLAFAASPWTEKSTYTERLAGKLEFGLTNTLLGWVDLFAEPNKAANEGKNVWGGLGKGLIDTVVNTVGGAFHLVTFPIPVDIPLPENGVDLS
ncbi:MAG: hypothetical protein HY447_00675 [Candidatus Omnitrophica bacterium]|nr:hypothetical protein [Candidatus Omnitrophota bacterium]